MSFINNVNSSPATGSVAMYDLMVVLQAAGWTIPESSDGTTHKMSGSITGGGAVAGGLGNNYAYFRAQDPGTRREFVFQKGTSGDTQWRIKYSALAKFISVAGTATDTPAATDEVYLLGGGTDAAPSFGALFNTNGTYRHHPIAQSVPDGNVYGFWDFCTTNGTGAVAVGICCEPLAALGQSASDQDPCVLIVGSISWSTNNFTYSGTSAKAWVNFNQAGAYFGTVALPNMTDPGSGAPWLGNTSTVGVNPMDTGDNTIPVLWGRITVMAGGSQGLKGVSKYMSWKFTSSRQYPDTLNLTVVDAARIYLNEFTMPWPDNITPLT